MIRKSVSGFAQISLRNLRTLITDQIVLVLGRICLCLIATLFAYETI